MRAVLVNTGGCAPTIATAYFPSQMITRENRSAGILIREEDRNCHQPAESAVYL